MKRWRIWLGPKIFLCVSADTLTLALDIAINTLEEGFIFTKVEPCGSWCPYGNDI